MTINVDRAFPAHPLGWRCDKCPCWQKSLKIEMIYHLDPSTNQPVAAPASIFDKQHIIPPPGSMRGIWTAPCSRFPNWHPTCDRSYCWEFPDMVKKARRLMDSR